MKLANYWNSVLMLHIWLTNATSSGTTMGSPVSVSVANLVMDNLEERAVSEFVSPPIFWKRNVDNICTALPKKLVQQFLEHLNFLEQLIKVTDVVEVNDKLAFLETEVTHLKDGAMTTSVYQKNTHTYILLHDWEGNTGKYFV